MTWQRNTKFGKCHLSNTLWVFDCCKSVNVVNTTWMLLFHWNGWITELIFFVVVPHDDEGSGCFNGPSIKWPRAVWLIFPLGSHVAFSLMSHDLHFSWLQVLTIVCNRVRSGHSELHTLDIMLLVKSNSDVGYFSFCFTWSLRFGYLLYYPYYVKFLLCNPFIKQARTCRLTLQADLLFCCIMLA